MADPTNIAVPPSRAADPTNIASVVHGTKFPSGVTGADQTKTLSQGLDMGASATDTLLDQWTAEFDCYVRQAADFAATVTTTASWRLLNSTQAVNVIGPTTPTTGAGSAAITTITTPNINKGDVIQLLGTTAGSSALKGLRVHLFITQRNGSTTNPL
jgi:hypothetical protein